jgi:hypothetical protein
VDYHREIMEIVLEISKLIYDKVIFDLHMRCKKERLMRFGIMAMQVDALIPADLLPENALAKITGLDHAALISQLAGQGFD